MSRNIRTPAARHRDGSAANKKNTEKRKCNVCAGNLAKKRKSENAASVL